MPISIGVLSEETVVIGISLRKNPLRVEVGYFFSKLDFCLYLLTFNTFFEKPLIRGYSKRAEQPTKTNDCNRHFLSIVCKNCTVLFGRNSFDNRVLALKRKANRLCRFAAESLFEHPIIRGCSKRVSRHKMSTVKGKMI